MMDLWYNNIKNFLTYTKISIFMQYIMWMPPTLKNDAVCSLQTSANAYQTTLPYPAAYNILIKKAYLLYNKESVLSFCLNCITLFY